MLLLLGFYLRMNKKKSKNYLYLYINERIATDQRLNLNSLTSSES